MSRRAGVCIDIWEEGEVSAAMYAGEDRKGRLRVVTRQGREMNIPESRIANIGEHTLDPEADRNDLGRRLRAREDELGAKASGIDLASLWEVLADDGGEYGLADLADLALGSRDGEARAALLRRLLEDKLYFIRRHLAFAPRSREDLGETVRRRRTEEERALLRAAFVAEARRAMTERRPPAWPDGATRLIEPLRDLAVHGLDTERAKEAQALLQDLGASGRGEPWRAAFEVLVELGVFSPDENLLLAHHAVQREFSAEVLAEAERVAAAGARLDPGRRDLQGLACYAIDDAETTEVDDAISFQDIAPGRVRLGIHVADPEPYVPHGGVLDLSARERATTYYLPEERILMLPPPVAEGVGSLAAGEPRTALSFLVDLDETSGEVLGREIVESVIRVRSRLTYRHTDTLIAMGGGAPGLTDPADAWPTAPVADDERAALPPGLPEELPAALARAARLARKLLERRAAAGALILKGPDLDLKVVDGRIRIRRIEPWTPAWVLVSESMVLANRLSAEALRSRSVPAIYRRQASPDKPLVVPRHYDPAAAAAARRQLKPTELSLTPGPHAALGLDAYVQSTSPLRRYQDLACHRQLKAALAGRTPPFDAETLWGVAAATDEAEKAARAIERGNREYWLLKHLDSLPADTTLEAVVTRPEERRTLIELADYAYFTQIQPRAGHTPGRRVRVVVDAVDPRGARLVLREVGAP